MALEMSTIIDGSVKMTEFLGGTVTAPYPGGQNGNDLLFTLPEDTKLSLFKSLSLFGMKFHKSFDWLLPVWKKLIKETIRDGNFKAYYGKFHIAVNDNKIEDAFLVVLDCLKKYSK